MRILLTGGGTAGHAWPIILVAQSLMKNKRAKILYVGSRQGIEKTLAKEAGVPFKKIHVGKKRAYFSLSNYWDIFKTLCGIIESLFIIMTFRPDVIFSKGGYVSVPIIFWLGFFKIPLVIHESDAVMGQANLWAAKYAKKICLGFPIQYYKENFPLKKIVYTGVPVKDEFLQAPIKTGDRPKILITGGSQGSQKINSIVYEILDDLLKKYDIYHLTGKLDYEKFQKIKNPYYHSFDFTDQMPKIMRDADLIISRAGASSLMEIAASGKTAIIIPLESAKGEHQVENAKVFKNCAVILGEKNLSSNSLLAIINNLMEDGDLRKMLAHHVKSFYQPKSSEEIIETIFESINVSA